MLWANDATVAYGAQKPWLLNNTVKNNILFGQPFINARYQAILEACSLKSDLEILPAGETDVYSLNFHSNNYVTVLYRSTVFFTFFLLASL